MIRFRLLLALCPPLVAQHSAPAFEVASVKPNTSGEIRQSSQIGNGSGAKSRHLRDRRDVDDSVVR